jgi:hypothetical protein
MASLRDVVFDAAKPAALARFWAAILDGYDIRPYDDEEIARLATLGRTPETDYSVMVDGPGPTINFQEITDPKVAKNRVHPELVSDDRPAEVARAVELGATIYYEGDGWTTLQDPEGNEFCIADLS